MAAETATTFVNATGTAPAITTIAATVQHAATTASGGAKLTALGGAASPTAVLKGMQAFAAAHPLAMLGMVGGGLALLGIRDTVRHFRNKRRLAESIISEKIW
jgi:hypothetical protein